MHSQTVDLFEDEGEPREDDRDVPHPAKDDPTEKKNYSVESDSEDEGAHHSWRRTALRTTAYFLIQKREDRVRSLITTGAARKCRRNTMGSILA